MIRAQRKTHAPDVTFLSALDPEVGHDQVSRIALDFRLTNLD